MDLYDFSEPDNERARFKDFLHPSIVVAAIATTIFWGLIILKSVGVITLVWSSVVSLCVATIVVGAVIIACTATTP